MRPRVFIHTNPQQWLGALVSAHSLRRSSAHATEFDIETLDTRDYPFLAEREGQPYLRLGERRTWRMDDLQSFTPLRFLPPRLMGHQGRALVIDPDVFAVGDVNDLLQRDMQGRGVLGRRHPVGTPERPGLMTSVMLLDCERLRHWRCEEQFADLFRFECDYRDWMSLRHEPVDNLGFFEEEWNDTDRLTPRTKLLHYTRRRTQPWKTGLPLDHVPVHKVKRGRLADYLHRLRDHAVGKYAAPQRYEPHPDPNQESFFFGLLRECLEQGVISEGLLREEMARDHVRHDLLQVLERTPPLPLPTWTSAGAGR